MASRWKRWTCTRPAGKPIAILIRNEIQRIELKSPSNGWPRITAELNRCGWEGDAKPTFEEAGY